jgi:hypothetical protein
MACKNIVKLALGNKKRSMKKKFSTRKKNLLKQVHELSASLPILLLNSLSSTYGYSIPTIYRRMRDPFVELNSIDKQQLKDCFNNELNKLQQELNKLL